MSPALLDPGAPSLSVPHSCNTTNTTNPIYEQRQVVQNFLVLLETSMNPSNMGDLNHGFSFSTRNSNQNFDFNHPRSSSSSSSSRKSGLSRPRFTKYRRQLNSQNLKSSEESCVGSGFNPFTPVPSEVNLGSSGSSEFGGGRSNVGVNSYSGNGIVEQMGSLGIGSGNEFWKSNANVGDKSGFVFGSDHSVEASLKKLSIDEKEKGAEGGSKLSANVEAKYGVESGDNVGCSIRTNVDSVLPNELKKKLNIGGTADFDGGNSNFKANNMKKFEFGKSENAGNIFVESSENALTDRINNLNIKDSVDTSTVNNRGTQKDSFLFGSRGSTSGHVGEESESTFSSQMGHNLNIGNGEGQSLGHTDMGCSSSRILGKDMTTGNKVDMNLHDFGYTVPREFVFKEKMQGKDASCTRVPIDQSKVDTHPIGVSGPSRALPSSSLASGNTFTAPPVGGLQKTDGFSFTSKQDGVGSPFVEFKTPNPKSNVFTGSNLKPEFNTKFKESKVKKRRGKLKQPMKDPLRLGQDFVSRESGYQETQEASESYSPMDISPYRETVSDPQNSRGTSVASEESFTLDNQHASTDSRSTVQTDAIDEDLVAATQRMDINEEDVKCGETEEENSQHCFDISVGAENHPEESISGAETESFKSANEDIDSINEVMVASVESEASSSTNIERLDRDLSTVFFSAASSEDTVTSGFAFAAASAAQASPKRHIKKKSWAKIGNDSFNSTQNTKGSYASAPLQFIPFCGASLSLSPARSKNVGLSTPALVVGDNAEVLREEEIKKGSGSASIVSQESCEKWRLRGNQAYASGDLSKAEDCYTQGVNCVSRNETSRSCLRALMLCFSNRAATRMSLGRMRDALRDCDMAAAIDPNFLRVQLRAANCYLALGEVEDALQYFKKCMHLGTDVCADRKIVVEASNGLQEAQKVFECMQHSAELLQQRLPNDALQLIAECLLISPYSEKFLEMKAESLFMLRNYEDVIQLCEHTFDSAKKNSPLLHVNYCIENLDSELTKDTSFMIWRCRLLFKSYFYLGRLEEAIGSLEKQQELHSVAKNAGVTQESLAPLVDTVRELLRHKAAGNGAFQAGKHSKAIEHYTAALSRNIESRPFAAICFCNRAAAYKALGQITDAIADCSLAIALDGNYLKAISRRATLYEMIRDYGQAANDLQRLVDVITKQVEQNTNQFGHCDRTINLENDLRQARLRLSTVEEEGRKEIPLNMYLILGIESSASASEIKKAYRKAALRHHPDKAGQSLARSDNGDDGLWKEIGEEVQKDADRLFKMIGEAYAVLSDPDKRLEYDLKEATRNDPKNHSGSSTYRTQTETHNYPFERSNSRRQWRDVWKTCGSRPGSRYE